jgi:hypothetical protein
MAHVAQPRTLLSIRGLTFIQRTLKRREINIRLNITKNNGFQIKALVKLIIILILSLIFYPISLHDKTFAVGDVQRD